MTRTDPDTLTAQLAEHGYVASDEFATTLSLTLTLKRPLLLEGPAGVGKTMSAAALAASLGTRLIRLQCYEGLDASSALYEWNYARQLLHLRLSEGEGLDRREREAEIYSADFLLRRPLLEAISQPVSPVLLIDEVDRADEAFEAFLLELLSEWQISIPELGTVKAEHPPHVILTSNRSRELSDALRRRCLYLWQGYPSAEEESRILAARVPGIGPRLSAQIVATMAALRALPLRKVPGVAETLDWALALMSLDRASLDPQAVALTRSTLLKVREDWALLDANMGRLERLWDDQPSSAAPGGAATERLTTDFGIGSVRVR